MEEEELDAIDEASAESFPASDAPAFTTLHAGMPAHEAERTSSNDWRRLAVMTALFIAAIVAGAWVLSRRSSR